MITVEDALKIVSEHIDPICSITDISINDASGSIVSEDIKSPINMPPFRQSAMDGYALNMHESDTYRLTGEVKAGDGHQPILEQGEAVRIFTGAAVPETANSVVIQERVIRNDNTIELESFVNINDNIRPLGEQVLKGDVALKKGTKLTPAALGYLTSLGITHVNVFSKPKIAIIVTGNELIKAGKELTYGKIYESNSTMLHSALNNMGYLKVTVKKVTDDYPNTLKVLNEIITNNDLVLISGGISVGDYDFVGRALHELNVEQLFYKVSQKPGKPLFFGKREGSIVFALPGNPASALSCFYIYVQTALELLSGNLEYRLARTSAVSTNDYTKKGDRAQFLKAIIKDEKVEILEGQSSAMLQTFALANALVYIPGNTYEISKGDHVEVILLPK